MNTQKLRERVSLTLLFMLVFLIGFSLAYSPTYDMPAVADVSAQAVNGLIEFAIVFWYVIAFVVGVILFARFVF